MNYDRSGIARGLAATVLIGFAVTASPVDLSIYSAGAVKAALSEVAANYERATRRHVNVEYAPVGTLTRRLADGDVPDIVILTGDVMPAAETNGWVMPGSAVALGSVGVGVAVREGAIAPDISTPESFKQALLAAKSIIYMDPEKGTSGKHFADVLRRMGIAEAMKAKTTLGNGGYVVEPVASGEIELGIQQITEIRPVKGVKLVGPLPEPFQKLTVYSAAVTTVARDPEAARHFLAYLRRSENREIFIGKGFLPP